MCRGAADPSRGRVAFMFLQMGLWRICTTVQVLGQRETTCVAVGERVACCLHCFAVSVEVIRLIRPPPPPAAVAAIALKFCSRDHFCDCRF